MFFSWCSVWDVCVKSRFSRWALSVSVTALNWWYFSCSTPSLSFSPFRSSPRDSQSLSPPEWPTPIPQWMPPSIQNKPITHGDHRANVRPPNSFAHRWPKPNIRCSFLQWHFGKGKHMTLKSRWHDPNCSIVYLSGTQDIMVITTRSFTFRLNSALLFH